MQSISTSALGDLARALTATHDVFAPRPVGEGHVLDRVGPSGGEIPWNPYRLAEPLKGVWFQPGRIVARWPEDDLEPARHRPRAVFGVKACDLKALACLDKVLRDHDFKDPSWCAARASTLIVAGDCTDCAATCFCTVLGDAPHPTGSFDLCLSPIAGGYLVETDR